MGSAFSRFRLRFVSIRLQFVYDSFSFTIYEESNEARSKRRSIHAPNLTDELSTAEERPLNQFGSARLVWWGKQRQIRQGLSHYATLERQLIHTAFSSCVEPNA